MGVVGIIPIIAETFGVTVPDAGWTVSLFALIIAFSTPISVFNIPNTPSVRMNINKWLCLFLVDILMFLFYLRFDLKNASSLSNGIFRS